MQDQKHPGGHPGRQVMGNTMDHCTHQITWLAWMLILAEAAMIRPLSGDHQGAGDDALGGQLLAGVVILLLGGMPAVPTQRA